MNRLPPGLRPNAAHVLMAAPWLFVVLWATGFVGARLGVPYAEPFTLLLLRFLIAAGLLFLLALVMRAPWPRSARAVTASIAAGALIQGIYLGGIFWAISRGMPAGVAALIVALQPLVTAILVGVLLGERVTTADWMGLAIGLLGVSLVLAPRLELAGVGITPATIAAAFIGVLGIVFGSISQKALSADADLRTGTCLQYVGGALVVGVAALFSESFHVEWTAPLAFALAWMVIVLSLAAVSLYLLLIRHGAVARVATLLYLVPPVTALMAWAMFNETLTWLQISGMAITAAGVALVTRQTAG